MTKTKGNFFEPTVLTDCDHSMRVMRDESFGPLIGIQKVSGDAEAVRLMKDTDYGLTAGVYSKNLGHAERVLEKMDTGSVYWNCCGSSACLIASSWLITLLLSRSFSEASSRR